MGRSGELGAEDALQLLDGLVEGEEGAEHVVHDDGARSHGCRCVCEGERKEWVRGKECSVV